MEPVNRTAAQPRGRRPVDGAARTTRPSTRRDVQGLRGIAVLVVVLFHAGLPLQGGFVGVDVFFVISGYVITAMLARELSTTGRISFTRFYARRVRRLLPALAVVLVVTALGSALCLSPAGSQQQAARTAVAASVFLANVEIFRSTGGYFDLAATTNPLLHTWTLAVEEQFYVIFPTLLLLAWLFARRVGRALRVAAMVTVAAAGTSFALSLTLSYGSATMRQLAFYSSPTRAWEFAAGALVALAGQRLARLRRGWPAALSITGILLIALAVVGTSGTMPFPGLVAGVPVVGTALVIASGTVGRSAVGRWLSVPWLVWLGDLSYSWYLWHWPLIVFAAALWPASTAATSMAAALSLVPAWWSYRRIEEPIRSDTSFVGRRAVGLAVICVMVPVLAAAGLYAGAESWWGSSRLRALGAQVLPTGVALRRGCQADQDGTSRAWDAARCTFDSVAGGRPIYLVGDSNAGMLTEGVVDAGRRLGRPVVVRTRSGCPLVDLALQRDGVDQPGCQGYVHQTRDWLLQQPPGVVVLAAASDRVVDDHRYPGYVQYTVADPVTGHTLTTAEDKSIAYERQLEATIASLRSAGQSVLLVQTIPHFFGWDPAGCPMLRSLTSGCGVAVPMAQMESQQRWARSAEVQAARRTGALLVDLRPELCPDDVCRTDSGGRWLYRNGTHLSVGGSLAAGPVLARALSR